MAVLAMWLQDAAAGGFSPTEQTWIVISLIGIAVALLIQAIFYLIGGMIALRAFIELKGTVNEVRRDLKNSADEVKSKLYPVVDGLMEAGRKTHELIDDSVPKIKIISDHLVETSKLVRDTAEKLGHTVNEANQKTQRQVARVDHMVTAALDTTAEVVATVEHGIKVPAQKIAQMATQARFVAEGVLDRLKGMASGLPFMRQHNEPSGARYSGTSSSASRPPAARPGSGLPAVQFQTPPAAPGQGPLVK